MQYLPHNMQNVSRKIVHAARFIYLKQACGAYANRNASFHPYLPIVWTWRLLPLMSVCLLNYKNNGNLRSQGHLCTRSYFNITSGYHILVKADISAQSHITSLSFIALILKCTDGYSTTMNASFCLARLKPISVVADIL